MQERLSVQKTEYYKYLKTKAEITDFNLNHLTLWMQNERSPIVIVIDSIRDLAKICKLKHSEGLGTLDSV